MLGIMLTAAGVVLTLAFTVLAVYASVVSGNLFLPTPVLPHILAIGLPILNFLALVFSSVTAPKLAWLRLLPPGTANTIISLLDTVLITFASAEIRPDTLLCSVEHQWRALFLAKNEGALRGIQDALVCCGFRSQVDQAWPLPGNGRGARACLDMYHRDRSCMSPLMNRERTVLGIWMAIGITGLVLKAIVIVVRRERPNWLDTRQVHRYIPQGRIMGNDSEGGRFLDEPEEESSRDQATLEGHGPVESSDVHHE